MPNCFAIGDIETEIFSYKFIKGTFFKFSDISLNNTGDTTQIVSFYFERLKLIKIEVLVSGKLRKLENHYSLYYKAQKLLLYRAGNFPFSDSIYNKNIDAHYLKRAKKLAKKAKTKSWKFPNY